MDLRVDTNSKLQDLMNRQTGPTLVMEASTGNTHKKINVNTIGNNKAKIYINRVQLEEVNSLKYLRATLSKDGSCSTNINIRIARATMAKLDMIYYFNIISINFASKYMLCKPLLIFV